MKLAEKRVEIHAVLPEQEEPVAPTFLPYYYPKVQKWAFIFQEESTKEEDSATKGKQRDDKDNNTTSEQPNNKVSMEVVFLDETTWRNMMVKVASQVLKKLKSWGVNHERTRDTGGYQKLGHYDRIFPCTKYRETYDRLKKKYKDWASKWTEGTDPIKYVFEDIQIASYLISLWEIEELRNPHSQKDYKCTFVDLGCGNGFLVYLLTMEGYLGKGIDLQKRKIWDEYPENVVLEKVALIPEEVEFEGVDWIIGNHSDELTPWIPYIASRSGYSTKYFVLPCCFFDFSGKFKSNDQKKGKYLLYREYIEYVGTQCGYEVEWDTLRIPSTKNVAQIGRKRTAQNTQQFSQQIQANHKLLLKDYTGITFPVNRDPEWHRERAKKQRPYKPKKRLKVDTTQN